MKNLKAYLAITSLGFGALGASVGVPHQFNNGDVADAELVNQNFQVLAAAINDVSGNVSAQGNALHPVAVSGNYEDLLYRPSPVSTTEIKVSASSNIPATQTGHGYIYLPQGTGHLSFVDDTGQTYDLLKAESDGDTDPNNELQGLQEVLAVGGNANAQGIHNLAELSIGTVTPEPSAALSIDSTTKGFLPPRMTIAQRDAITPVAGLMIFCVDAGASGDPQYFNGVRWMSLTGGAAKGPVSESEDIASRFTTTNTTGASAVGQSFTVGAQGGYLTRVVTNAIGGVTGTQLTNGINGSVLKIREYINDVETGTSHALTGNVLATSVGAPQVLDTSFGASYPSAEFDFGGVVYLEANTKYVVEIVAGAGVATYCKVTDQYAGGQAYAIDGINLGSPRDMPISVYLKYE